MLVTDRVELGLIILLLLAVSLGRDGGILNWAPSSLVGCRQSFPLSQVSFSWVCIGCAAGDKYKFVNIDIINFVGSSRSFPSCSNNVLFLPSASYQDQP